MQWIAVFTRSNPYFDTETLVIDTIYPSKNKLIEDVMSNLCVLEGPFKGLRPHPDDRYEIRPTQLRDNKLQKLERKVGGYMKEEVVHHYAAERIFKWWDRPIKKVQDSMRPALTKEEKRLQVRLSKEFFRGFEQTENTDWYFRVHQFSTWMFGLIKLGLPALIEDMKKDEEERRNLFAGPLDNGQNAKENNDAAAE